MSKSRIRPAGPTRPLRAVIYVRLSSYRGDSDPTTSPARQEAVCRAYCEAKGWDVVEVVSDLDVSGSDKGQRLQRPGLDKIRALWWAVDIVIFAKLDRLARNVIDFRRFADEAEENSAALVSVQESLDMTTPGGKFVATILAAFAEMEAATIAARTLDGMEAARELGRYVGGPRPFGYRIAPHPSGKGKILVPDAAEAEVVRELARRVLAGETIYSLSKDLNARGVPLPVSASGKQGAMWRQSGVSRLLTSAHLIGRVMVGGDFRRDEHGEPRQMWEPILNLDDWHRLRAQFAPSEEGKRKPRKRADWLLSGLVRCGLCGGPCNAGVSQHGTRRYRCASMGNAGKCSGVSIAAEPLEGHVETEALSLVGHLPTVRIVETIADDGRRTDIEASLAALAKQITEPGADVAAIAARIAAFSAERDALPATSGRETRVIETGLTLAEDYAAAESTAERRALLSGLLLGVRVAKGRRGVHGFDDKRVDPVWSRDGVALRIRAEQLDSGAWIGEPIVSG